MLLQLPIADIHLTTTQILLYLISLLVLALGIYLWSVTHRK